MQDTEGSPIMAAVDNTSEEPWQSLNQINDYSNYVAPTAHLPVNHLN